MRIRIATRQWPTSRKVLDQSLKSVRWYLVVRRPINHSQRRNFLASGSIAALLVIASALPIQAQDRDALARIEGFLVGLRSLRAEVAQRYHDRAHDRDLEAAGTLALARPDRLTVRFRDGRGLALTGESVVAVEPDADLVHTHTLSDDAFAELRGLLAGTSTLGAVFDVRAMGPSASGDVLEIRPRSRSAWDRALVSVGEDGVPTRILVVDPAGNTLRWVLRRVTRAATLPAGALSLPVPDGATTIAP